MKKTSFLLPRLSAGLLAGLLCTATSLQAQTPTPITQWTRNHCPGGESKAIALAPGGGFFVCGEKQQHSSDPGHHGAIDGWVARLRSNGTIDWSLFIGGSDDDHLSNMQSTVDGGVILIGYTQSNDGDVNGNHGSNQEDIWVVKMNGTGQIEWQRCLGGSSQERGAQIRQTTDGGYILTGSTYSTDGDVSRNAGYSDTWVVKLDGAGRLEWEQSYGGTGSEGGACIIQTADGGYLAGATMYAVDRNTSLLKLNSTGGLEWEKGMGLDFFIEDLAQRTNGDYAVTGSLFRSSYDIYLAVLDGTGTVLWDKTYGGSDQEQPSELQPTPDGGFVIAGHSGSNDGDVSGNNGMWDGWLLKVDATGTIDWQKCFGSNFNDRLTGVRVIPNGYVITSTEPYEDDLGNRFTTDVTVRKLTEPIIAISRREAPSVVAAEPSLNQALSISPNPAADRTVLEMPVAEAGTARISVYSMSGARMLEQTAYLEKGMAAVSLDLRQLAPGTYSIIVQAPGHLWKGQLVKQ